MMIPKLSFLSTAAIGCFLSISSSFGYRTNSVNSTSQHDGPHNNGFITSAHKKSSFRQQKQPLIIRNHTLSTNGDSSRLKERFTNSSADDSRKLQSSAVCTIGRNRFRTSILVTHEGDLADVTNAEVDSLERLIEYLYNRENDRMCDGMVRRITSVTADRTSAVRSLGVAPPMFRIRYNILGCCYNCHDDNGPLFGTLASVSNTGALSMPPRCRGYNVPRRGPDETETVNAINRAIDVSQVRGYDVLLQPDLQNIENIDQLMELQAHRCNDADQFQTFVRIETPGSVLYSLTEEEQQILEDLVMEVYNEMNFFLCDYPLFRAISEVDLVNVDFGPNAVSDEMVILLFGVSGVCHGRDCNGDTDIFTREEDVNRNLQRSRRDRSFWWGTTGSNNGITSCYCPSNMHRSNRAPTTGEYQIALNEAFANLYEEGGDLSIHSALVTIENVVEVNQFDCGPKIEFTALEFIDLGGFGLGGVSGEELGTLGNAYAQLYNTEASFDKCDAFFRNIGLSQVQPDDVRKGRLADEQRNRRLEDSGGDLPSLFQINGNCRNCPLSDASSVQGSFSLFSDSLRRRQQEIPTRSSKIIEYRVLQESDYCYCPVGTEPNFDDTGNQDLIFASTNNVITDLRSRGLVSTLNTIQDSPIRVRCDDRVQMYNEVIELAYDAVGIRSTNTRLEDLFQDAFVTEYRARQSRLCDPFRRDIVSLSCVPISFSNSGNSRMGCNVTFECLGPCRDWIFYPRDGNELVAPLMFNYPESFEYDVFNCECLDLPNRGPTMAEVMESASLRHIQVLSYGPQSLALQFVPVGSPGSIDAVVFTLTFYYYHNHHYYHHLDDPTPEDLAIMPNIVSEFFFDDLTSRYRDGTIVYFLTQISNYEVDESDMTIDITFETIPEFTVDSEIPSIDEILAIMERTRMSEFLHDYIQHSEFLPSDSTFRDAQWVGFSEG